jgi:hypothetical protein
MLYVVVRQVDVDPSASASVTLYLYQEQKCELITGVAIRVMK